MQAALDVLAMGEVFPAGHARQVVAIVAPAVEEYVLAPQSVHKTDPVVVLYLPATQEVHGPPLGPVYPVLQTHPMISPAADALVVIVFAGHDLQSVGFVAANLSWYVFAGQDTQAVAPTVEE